MNPESLRTAVATWSGERRFEGETGRGGRFAVESADGIEGARPTELVLAALASCAGLDVIAILEKKRQSVGTYRVTATGEQQDEHPQIFRTIVVDHEVSGAGLAPDAVRRAIELSASRYCPVSAMLSMGTTSITHRFRIDPASEDWTEVLVTGPHGHGLLPPR